MKSVFGGLGGFINTIASAATVSVPDEESVFFVSGTTTITTLNGVASARGRVVWFVGADASGATQVTFTNTNGTTTAGQMDLGNQSNVVLSDRDVLCLYLTAGGYWIALGQPYYNGWVSS